MSKQLSVASAFSIFALSALAIFAPALSERDHARSGGTHFEPTTVFTAGLPLID